MSEGQELTPKLDIRDSIKATDLEALFLQDEFAATVLDSIKHTNKPPFPECSFTVFNDPAQQDGSFYISSIFEGEHFNPETKFTSGIKGMVKTGVHERRYLAEVDAGEAIQTVLDCHTHPPREERFEVLEDRLLKVVGLEAPRVDLFSREDLRAFQARLRRNPNHISAIIAKDSNELWNMVLISKKKDAKDFNPSLAHIRATQYDRIGKDPYDVYREVGLNVTSIKIDMKSEFPLNIQDVRDASKILTS